MIEKLFPVNKLYEVSPPRMSIGPFTTFIGYNPLGKGQQAVHNSGSSMLRDTPSFKGKVIGFLNEYFDYHSYDFEQIMNNGIDVFIQSQVESLNQFKSDSEYRRSVLSNIFHSPYKFRENVNPKYLYITLMLFFVREYNYFRSTKDSHEFTKQRAREYYADEEVFLKAYYEVLLGDEAIGYLLDVCYGRYYFLEVHFSEHQKVREVPKSIVEEFISTGVNQAVKLSDEDIIEQERIYRSLEYQDDDNVAKANEREPILEQTGQTQRYRKNSRLAKTVLKNNGYKCDVDTNHKTFLTSKDHYFIEAHHLIPMGFQRDFLPTNIDREENIVSLCPNCHRAVHYGSREEKKARLLVLYEKRVGALSKCGISVTFKRLIDEFYGEKL